MYRFTAVIGGLVAGAIGAAVWAVIARFTGFEIGWIAWGIGVFVGLGVALGNRGEGSTAAGVLAAAVAIMAVVVGKYLTVRMLVPEKAALVANAVAALDDPELLVSYLADDVVSELEAQGTPVVWPAGVDPHQAAHKVEYPPEVWTAAQSRWDGMSPEDREAYRRDRRARIELAAAAFHETIARSGFLHAFGLMDLIFFGLAVATAFKIGRAGTGREGGDVAGQGPSPASEGAPA